MQLVQSNISQRIHKLLAPYLRKNNANYLVYHVTKNCAVIKTFNVSKHKKSRVHFSTNSKQGLPMDVPWAL